MEDTSWMFEIDADGAKTWAEGMSAGLMAGAKREDDARESLEMAIAATKAKRVELKKARSERRRSVRGLKKMAEQLFGSHLVEAAIAKVKSKAMATLD